MSLLVACNPPATDEYVERIELSEARDGPSTPLDDPDVEGAVWVPIDGGSRLLFGKPGATPMLALECEDSDGTQQIEITRYVKADPQAQALMALVGNSHVARVPVDALWNGKAWLWIGSVAADNPDLAVFTGRRGVEATVPGAGSLNLAASPMPAELIRNCQRMQEPENPSPE